jgi:hypothetical protein
MLLARQRFPFRAIASWNISSQRFFSSSSSLSVSSSPSQPTASHHSTENATTHFGYKTVPVSEKEDMGTRSFNKTYLNCYWKMLGKHKLSKNVYLLSHINGNF